IAVTFSSVLGGGVPVFFTQSGLAASTPWQVWVNSTGGGPNYRASGTGPTAAIEVQPGAYVYEVGNVSHAVANPSSGAIAVGSTALSLGISFSTVTYVVTFTETGLPSGTVWALTFGGVIHWSSSPVISFPSPTGSYRWNVGFVAGYASNATASNPLSIANSGAAVAILFTESPVAPDATTDCAVALVAADPAMAGASRNVASDVP
ncbi:MAG: hypothetical protein WBF81_00950, partial [Thermoplasmata archaeon]